MRLQHTTLRKNLRSILKNGIQTRYSKGKLPAVWLHAPDKTFWAFLHVVKRHGGDVHDVVTIDVDVPDDMLRCSSVVGLFYTLEDVDPSLLGQVKKFATVAASPLECQ